MAATKKTEKKAEEVKTVKKAAVKAAAAKKPTAKKADAKPAVKAAAEKKPAVRKVAKPASKKPAAKKSAELIIQSPMGGNITPEEILAKIGKADKVYIRVDENKAYWVRGEETGSVDLWD